MLDCSKDEATRLVRKLVVEGVLREETHRQDNQYGSLTSKLVVHPPTAGSTGSTYEFRIS